MSDPTANPKPEASSADTSPAHSSPADTSSADTSSAEVSNREVAQAGEAPETGKSAAPPAEGEGSKPSDRIRIGTQRKSADAAETAAAGQSSAMPAPADEPLAPKPVTPVTKSSETTKKPSKYPPPNVRAALTDEQEAELEQALAGESLDDLIDQSASTLAAELPPETKVTGKVSTQHSDYLFVDLGGHRQGTIPLKQFSQKTADGVPAEVVLPEPDSEIEVVVVRLNAEEGLYELNLPTAAVDVGNWDEVEVGQIVGVTVTGVNKGGLECQAAGIRAFMPMGQISTYRVENPEEYVGQKINAVVTEANREKRNLVLSHRAVMERERAANREKLMAELAPGQMREGVVRSLRDFGAFVDLGGVDGLIHVSKMSWDRVNHPSEVLSEGQTVKVKVERIDPDTGKIGLSYRESAENPWDGVDAKYPIGAKVTGTVSKIMDFGAFVKLEPGVEGLIHISELAHARVHRTSDIVSEGQQVEVKVLSVDLNKQRIGLSLKALMAAPTKASD
ncbi:MAG: S1 RNA-binding domain-containing protein, partial [Planctomycetota bacterium]